MEELLSVEKIEINALIHATEDGEKVEKAVSSLIPGEMHSILRIRSLSGHYGNPIRLLTASVKPRERLGYFLKSLVAGLGSNDKALLLRELPLHMAGGSTLYVRLDKQAAARGVVCLGRGDPIQIKIKFRRGHGKNNLIELLKRMLRDA
jgi:RNA binding exosome subunit